MLPQDRAATEPGVDRRGGDGEVVGELGIGGEVTDGGEEGLGSLEIAGIHGHDVLLHRLLGPGAAALHRPAG